MKNWKTMDKKKTLSDLEISFLDTDIEHEYVRSWTSWEHFGFVTTYEREYFQFLVGIK